MNDQEIIKEFLVESYENLDQLDRDLVVLEKEPTDRQKLASIFRTIHTIKGTCGFLRFAKLEAVTHVGENLLSRLRDGRLLLNAEITSALLALVDAVRAVGRTPNRAAAANWSFGIGAKRMSHRSMFLVFGATVAVAIAAAAQRPDGEGPPPPADRGPGFRVLPPFAARELRLARPRGIDRLVVR